MVSTHKHLLLFCCYYHLTTCGRLHCLPKSPPTPGGKHLPLDFALERATWFNHEHERRRDSFPVWSLRRRVLLHFYFPSHVSATDMRGIPCKLLLPLQPEWTHTGKNNAANSHTCTEKQDSFCQPTYLHLYTKTIWSRTGKPQPGSAYGKVDTFKRPMRVRLLYWAMEFSTFCSAA